MAVRAGTVAVPARPRHAPGRHAPTERRLRIVRRARQRRVPFALFAVAVVSVLVFALTWAQALVAQGSFRVEELTRDVTRLERRSAELTLRVAVLSANDRIARWARKAGFEVRDPDAVQVLEVPTAAGGPDDAASAP